MPETSLKPVDVISLSPKVPTWAKISTAQSSHLDGSDKFLIKPEDKLLILANYRQSGKGHIQATAADETAIGKSIYLYGPDFPDCPQVMAVGATAKIERADGDSWQADKIFPGSCLELVDVAYASPGAGDNYADLELAQEYKGSRKWRIYHAELSEKCEIIGNPVGNNPIGVASQSNIVVSQGASIRLPWFNCPIDGTRKSEVYLDAPIISNGHFTWAEATKGGERVPANEAVVKGIIQAARKLEEIRAYLGNRAISINSWYRDPDSNRAVGGAKYSRHLNGDAVDFVVAGLHPYDVYDRLDGWQGNRGGLASSTVFTHLDFRGHYARWSYGF